MYCINHAEGGAEPGYDTPTARDAALQHIAEVINRPVPTSLNELHDFVSAYIAHWEDDGLKADFIVTNGNGNTRGFSYSLFDLYREANQGKPARTRRRRN
jgi:hypothetical protein